MITLLSELADCARCVCLSGSARIESAHSTRWYSFLFNRYVHICTTHRTTSYIAVDRNTQLVEGAAAVTRMSPTLEFKEFHGACIAVILFSLPAAALPYE
jgi:hypothetical protein